MTYSYSLLPLVLYGTSFRWTTEKAWLIYCFNFPCRIGLVKVQAA